MGSNSSKVLYVIRTLSSKVYILDHDVVLSNYLKFNMARKKIERLYKKHLSQPLVQPDAHVLGRCYYSLVRFYFFLSFFSVLYSESFMGKVRIVISSLGEVIGMLGFCFIFFILLSVEILGSSKTREKRWFPFYLYNIR